MPNKFSPNGENSRMVGIYKITNLLNQKCYIGQSRDIKRRWNFHKAEVRRNHIDTYLYRAMKKYGIKNFSFEIIELCNPEELNEKEIFWIKKYNSFKNGYNCTTGGHYGKMRNCGENHKNAKLTNKEVFEIREMRLQGKSRIEAYERFKNKISVKRFQHIWEGDRYTKIHMDVYEKVPVHRKPKLSYNKVQDLKNDFKNGMTKKELIKKYNVDRRTIERIVQNKTRREK